MFAAACLDQRLVGLVPFRNFLTLTLKLRMDNDAVCIVWYIIYSNGVNIVYCHVCPLYVVIKIILLQCETLIHLSHFISNLVFNVMLNVPLKLCTSQPQRALQVRITVLHLAKFIIVACTSCCFVIVRFRVAILSLRSCPVHASYLAACFVW